MLAFWPDLPSRQEITSTAGAVCVTDPGLDTPFVLPSTALDTTAPELVEFCLAALLRARLWTNSGEVLFTVPLTVLPAKLSKGRVKVTPRVVSTHYSAPARQ
jgi:hypothetical protein